MSFVYLLCVHDVAFIKLIFVDLIIRHQLEHNNVYLFSSIGLECLYSEEKINAKIIPVSS